MRTTQALISVTPQGFARLAFVLVAVGSVTAGAEDPAQRAKDAIVVRTLMRLPGIDLNAKPEAKAALLRHLESIGGTDQWLELVEKFKLAESKADVLHMACDPAQGTLAVKAARLLINWGEYGTLRTAIGDSDVEKATRLIQVLGLVADARTNELLAPLISSSDLLIAPRAAAVTAIGRNAPGQQLLLTIVENGSLPIDLQFATANALLSSADEAVRLAAAKHLSLPAAAGGQPLPPVADLVKRSGDPVRGKELFAGIGTCAKCHKVQGEGKEVGPDLSEIGSKLSKEALYASILDPNAGVSFNYETWLARTLDGTLLSGILVSQTDEAIELKTADAIVHKLERDNLDDLKKLPTSLMPADIQKQLQAEDLVDIVEYLTTLKKPS